MGTGVPETVEAVATSKANNCLQQLKRVKIKKIKSWVCSTIASSHSFEI
jgi:hypothetical protein